MAGESLLVGYRKGVWGLPPLSFGHFPRKRGQPCVPRSPSPWPSPPGRGDSLSINQGFVGAGGHVVGI